MVLSIQKAMLIGCMYVSREDGGRGLMSCEGCVRGEENSLEWYVRNSLDVLLQGVRVTAEIESGETVRKMNEDIWSNELTLHITAARSVFKRNTRNNTWNWNWLRKADLKIQTEALIVQARSRLSGPTM